jgi:hypothetical protein
MELSEEGSHLLELGFILGKSILSRLEPPFIFPSMAENLAIFSK